MNEKNLYREAWDKISVAICLLLGLIAAILACCLFYEAPSLETALPAEAITPQSSVEWVRAYTEWAEAQGGTAFVGKQEFEDKLLPGVLAWCDANLEPGYQPRWYIQYEGLWFTEITGTSLEEPRDEIMELWCLVLALDERGEWQVVSAWCEDTYTNRVERGDV